MPRTKTIRVTAPATLEEGFTFDVLLHGEPYTVTVPPGGVRKGDAFEIPYPQDDDESNQDEYSTETRTLPVQSGSQDDEDNIMELGMRRKGNKRDDRDALGAPMGRWRYPLFACCDVLTQATFWMASFCAPVLLAQLLTRLRLTWKGLPADTAQEASLSFNRIVLSFVVVLVIGIFVPIVSYFLILAYLLGLLVWVGGNLRRTMRQRYEIATSRMVAGFDCIEDGVCMCLCGCCSLVQMARQTHDDKEYPGMCCTTTGLELEAPSVPTISE